ncbi:para-aminobenzoate synthetase [Nocardiopsis sp. Huas11]|uniref:aminodeoxychorismate synthase component I n=1 Tax=Nocardiopsis sp. Huas11 TaxID=2183912 RepID=UPI000EAD12EB|nr:aminodeoxychorismate synthase component I [Nocardiopsis sp. Huas11]RKS08419.1 para-aminobenzoate synthetase [Nocardiopsis sp. Huas11]
MRVLLVDNYDSYTYNLFQLAAHVYGTEPLVLRNDAPEWNSLDLADLDGVILSPGPGRPQHPRDTGRCAELLAHSDLPVLGVCLGHQIIAHADGARVSPAPEPRHGHLTRVRHSGTELFDGVPQDFHAVRYHSLSAPEPLPASLEATAWSEDGVLMALRHRSLPRWGVQFHPESVATEHGALLLENFRRAAGRTRPRAVAPVREKRTEQASDSPPAPGRLLRLSVSSVDIEIDGAAAFGALYAKDPYAFWLDSGAGVRDARFSFLGSAGGPLGEVLTYDVREDSVTVRDAQGTRREKGSIFDVLAQRLRGRAHLSDSLPFDLNCGYVGYFGYELKEDCGAGGHHTAPGPDALWMFADRMIAVDHVEKRTYALAVSRTDQPPDHARAWCERSVRRLLELPPSRGADTAPSPAPLALSEIEPYLARDRSRYLADIDACLHELNRGESYEICLTNRVRLPPTDDLFSRFLRLRAMSPAPYAAYLTCGDHAVASSSPECFLRVHRDRTVVSRPIKGTAPRARDPRLDDELRRSLVESSKTYAENLMIVDLLRNDLGRVCQVGSVGVSDLMATESYATLHQLVSTVQGSLRRGVDAVECVRACFPGGSMTGAPKLRTMEIIDRLEDEPRGIYSGALGFFGLGGGADLSIVIRAMIADASSVVVGAGGAIVLDSDPQEEFEEMALKAMAPVRALLASPVPVQVDEPA